MYVMTHPEGLDATCVAIVNLFRRHRRGDGVISANLFGGLQVPWVVKLPQLTLPELVKGLVVGRKNCVATLARRKFLPNFLVRQKLHEGRIILLHEHLHDSRIKWLLGIRRCAPSCCRGRIIIRGGQDPWRGGTGAARRCNVLLLMKRTAWWHANDHRHQQYKPNGGRYKADERHRHRHRHRRCSANDE